MPKLPKLFGLIPGPRRLGLLLTPVLLSACATQPPVDTGPSASELAYRSFEECRQSALDMDSSAREQQSIAQYAQAAEILEQCVQSAAEDPQAVPGNEVMHLQALAVIDYIKAGDIDRAREQLDLFQEAFPGRDLYFDDRTSFIDTARVLLGNMDTSQSDRRYRPVMNTRSDTLSELKRRDYWNKH